MAIGEKDLSWQNGYGRIAGTVFFILFYLYVWLRVDTSLIHYVNRSTVFPGFFYGMAFLRPFLAYPGGPVEYAAAFLSQLYYYPWLGALVVTLLAALTSLCTRTFLSALWGKRIPVVHFVPAVLVLMMYNRYGLWMHTFLGLLAGLLFAAAYARLAPRRAALRLIAFLALSVPVYYMSAGGYLLFALLCGMFEVLAKRHFVVGALCILSGAAIPYAAGNYVFNLQMTDAYARSLPFHEDADPSVSVLALCLYLFLPLATVGVALVRVLRRGRVAEEIASAPVEGPSSGRGWAARVAWVLGSLALFGLAAVPVWLSLDGTLRGLLRIEYYSQHRMWPEVLEEVRRVPPRRYSRAVNLTVNRALYHTGQLLYSMFSFSQVPVGLLPTDKVTAFDLPIFGDILINLGCVNEAEAFAYEALAIQGDRPRILRRLALINTVKRQPETARLFLNVLARDVIHGAEARRELRRLDEATSSTGSREVRRLRSLMPREDSIWGDSIDAEALLEQQLERDPGNKMAFEYLMAHYLLTAQLEKVVLNVARLRDFGYPDIPRHYEEALLIYTATTGIQVDLHGQSISADSTRRFRDFARIVQRHRGSAEDTVKAIVEAGYGGSYFAYLAFAYAPEVADE